MFDLKFIQSLPSEIRLMNGQISLDGNLSLTREWKDGSCRSTLSNRSDSPVSIREVALFKGRFPIAASCPFYSEGYHMLSQHSGTLGEPRNIGNYGTDEAFFQLEKSPFSHDLYTAYSFMLLSPTQLDRVLMGFSSCYRFMGEFRFKNNFIEIVMDCEGISLRPGESWSFEEFNVYFGEKRDALFGAFADDIRRNHPRRPYPEIPFNWCSYHSISGVRDFEMIEQARAMHTRIPELRRIQIDAGFQQSTDWLIPNPDSGSDMKTMCDNIRREGCEPAGYFAPFTVGADSALFREHPDWLVMDADGHPTNEHCYNKYWYVLDGTHPEALEYIRKVTRTFHDEWGIRYLKLDFTSYGALPGKRHDPYKTRVEAFRAVFEAINEAAGGDTYILGCNAPFWCQLGLVDGNRATNDVFRKWETISGNMEELFGRSWQNGRLWINDPDGVVLEKRDRSVIRDGKYRPAICSLTDAEFEYHKAYIVACGGGVSSGDKLDDISDKNIEVLRRMMANTGEAAVYDDDSHEIGRIADKGILCVFNHSDDLKSIAVPLDRKYTVIDFWTDEALGDFTGHITLFDMAPHSARVLKIVPPARG